MVRDSGEVCGVELAQLGVPHPAGHYRHMVDVGVLDHRRQRVLGAACLELVPVLFPELCQPGPLRRLLARHVPPRSDASTAAIVVVPQPWLPDDRDGLPWTGSAADSALEQTRFEPLVPLTVQTPLEHTFRRPSAAAAIPRARRSRQPWICPWRPTMLRRHVRLSVTSTNLDPCGISARRRLPPSLRRCVQPVGSSQASGRPRGRVPRAQNRSRCCHHPRRSPSALPPPSAAFAPE
jgi:hypothetical protein